jgi:Ca2+-binding RTX toxin-like protein
MESPRKRPAYRLALLTALAAAIPLVLAASASAALTVTFSLGTLHVSSNADDAITITCVGGKVKVNAADPPGGTVDCAAVADILVQGGPGPNVIDLQGVAPATFVTLAQVDVFAGDGEDSVTGTGFDDSIAGNEGNDSLLGGPGNDSISGEVGNDTLDGGPGADQLFGYFFFNNLQVEAGTNTLVGGTGDDSLDPAAQTAVANGGDGLDLLSFVASAGADTLTATTADGTLAAGSNSTSYQGIERFSINGLDGNDAITTGSGDDFLNGDFGDDTLNAGGGDDFLFGGPGTDAANGQDGDDTLHFLGTMGNDTLTLTPPDGTLSAGSSTTNFTGIENGNLDGFFGDDVLTTGGGADVLSGNFGSDTLNAGAGDDRLMGGDFGFPGAITNTLNGGDGSDTMFFDGTSGNDMLTALTSDGSLSAGLRTDNYTSIQNFQINGFDGNDTISTGAGADVLQGGIGNDTLTAGDGNDAIAIASGTDSADGQAGSDEYFVFFGALGTVTIADTGPAPSLLTVGDEDAFTIINCAGVTVTATQAVKGGQLVNYSGIERPPCGFVAPPPPGPPPPGPPPPGPPPPGPPPPPSPPPPPVVVRPPTVVRCVVPNVKGKTVAKAKAALKARRCAAGKIKQVFSGKVKKGRVIAQSKRPGTRHPRNTKVNLTVSKGARKK